MSTLTPSTTAHTRQVWPPMPDSPYDRYHLRTPVTIDELQVGDVVSFIGEDRNYRPAVCEGKVIKINVSSKDGRRVLAQVQTTRGRCMLSRKHWDKQAPRR